MSVRDRLEVEHEGKKRRLEQDLEAYIRDDLSSEGMSNFLISAILTAAAGAIALFVTGVGALVGVIIFAIVGVAFYFTIDALSVERIKRRTEQFGRDEDREDENYLRSLERLQETE